MEDKELEDIINRATLKMTHHGKVDCVAFDWYVKDVSTLVREIRRLKEENQKLTEALQREAQ